MRRIAIGSDGIGSLPWLRRLAVIVGCWLLPLSIVFDAWAHESSRSPRVIILFSNDSSAAIDDAIVRGFWKAFETNTADHRQLFTEFLDTDRFTRARQQGRMATYLQEKYADTRVDLVVSVGAGALRFLSRHQGSLFPSSPLLFVGIEAHELQETEIPRNAVGMTGGTRVADTVELIRALQPDVTELLVITGAADADSEWSRFVREQIRSIDGGVKVRWFHGSPAIELLDRVRAAPRNAAIVVLTDPDTDGAGTSFVSRDDMVRITAAAGAPVYSVHAGYLGYGIVGGYLMSHETLGAEAALLADRILARGSLAGLHPPRASGASHVVDWRQLQRWGLDEARLPPATTVRFREPPLWERYRDQMLAVAAALILQSLLIGGLLLQVRRRRRAEQSFRESEERVSLAAEAAHLGLWRLDTATHRMWANDACRTLLGADARQPISRETFLNACHPDDRQKAVEFWSHGIASGAASEHEYRVVRSDGSFRWLLERARIFCDAESVPRRTTGVVIDITDRKLAEAALRQSEERYRNVVDTQADLICRYLPDTTLTFVNDAYCRYFKRSREELIGTRFLDLVPEQLRERILKQVASLVRHRRTVAYEHEVLMPDGSIGWQHWTDQAMVDAGGRVVEVQGVGRDLTDLRRAELEAEERRKEVTHLTRVAILGELSGALAHELNQPLTAILSNAQAAQHLLARPPIDLDEVRAILTDIANDDKRAGEVINRLRALMRKGEAQRQPLDLNSLAGEALRLAHSELLKRQITVRSALAPGLPEVLADRVQIQQVLLNLIVNACDSMSLTHGDDRVLEISTGLGAMGGVQLVVSDRGPGIPPHLIDEIFDPFVTTKSTGVGLGLSICRSIVAAHGGQIWADSNEGEGVSFFVSLPPYEEGRYEEEKSDNRISQRISSR